jgi:hypothetical protein
LAKSLKSVAQLGLGNQRLRHRETERPCCLQVDDQIELGRQLHWQIGGRCAAP